LLSECNENPPPLNDVIEHGHTQLALALIEQVIDMPSSNGLLEKANENGETPLLIAAKCNQWTLMKSILEKRCDLVKQKDKNDNNLLHLLADFSGEKGVEMLEYVLKMLPNDTRTELVKEKSKTNQTPMEIAQSRGNTQCVDILNFSLNIGEVISV
jgi:ankyrin repeat protein